jgi:hypothetical protein
MLRGKSRRMAFRASATASTSQPSSSERTYTLVPPTMTGTPPAVQHSSMCLRASATNVSSSSFRTGSVTSSIVCGTPRISSGVVLLVPMSMYR